MKSQGPIPYRKVGHLLRFDFDEIVEWTKDNEKCLERPASSGTIRQTSVAATERR